LREHPDQMVTRVLAAGYEDYLKETYENYRSRLEDLQQLAVFSAQFPSLQDFLAQLSLLSNVEAEDQSAGDRAEERLWLSSIHQAKGLEFDVVFVIMLCDGMFPSGHATEDMERLEEERRLFYVAITRARNRLYLSYPLYRMASGFGGDGHQSPSRFLSDIPRALLEEWNLAQSRMADPF
jgi:DNA helicase-2/ATP-dependent DNA helicase PcrA